MDILKRVLAVMVAILILVGGAGLYYATRHTGHGTIPGLPGTQQQKPDQVPDTKTTKPKVTVVLEPDLRNYIEEINRGISLINEANGLITADPFFADPPIVTRGRLETTPFDKQLPEQRDNPILLLPDGTYQIINNTGSDMRNIHRGIYKLGQGMTVLNSILDRMNDDIRNNNFSIRAGATGQNLSPQTGTAGMTNPGINMQNMPGMNTTTGTNNMTGMVHGTTAGSPFNWGTVSNFLYLVLIVFLFLAIISIIGFVLSLFRPRKENVE